MNIKISMTKTIERTMTTPEYMALGELKSRLKAVGYDIEGCTALVIHAGDGENLTTPSDAMLICEGDHVFFLNRDEYDAVKANEELQKAIITKAEQEGNEGVSCSTPNTVININGNVYL